MVSWFSTDCKRKPSEKSIIFITNSAGTIKYPYVKDYFRTLYSPIHKNQLKNVSGRGARFQDGGGWVVDRKAEVKATYEVKRAENRPLPTSHSPRSPAEAFRFLFSKQASKSNNLSTWGRRSTSSAKVENLWTLQTKPEKKLGKEGKKNKKQRMMVRAVVLKMKDPKTNYPGHGKIGWNGV